MPPDLDPEELAALVERVFCPRPGERRIAVLADLPDEHVLDNPRWHARRRLAAEWTQALFSVAARTGLEPQLVVYRNVRRNNAELPYKAWRIRDNAMPDDARELDPATATSFPAVFRRHPLLLAPTEFSTTAPLKLAAKSYGLRAATMPGFSVEMIPALRLDYTEIDRRVRWLKTRLDAAEEARLGFEVGGRRHELLLDLRFRVGHASGGLVTEPGSAGNLPSGESYIVPYEGEDLAHPSRSAGELPVELEGEVVVYRIAGNRAVEVLSDGPVSRREAEAIVREPAYANLAELGLGVLSDFGIAPIGEILLDEKLGLHIAFGRSDHFGGQVGPEDFSSPEAVVHIDRVYLPQTQPQVRVAHVELRFPDQPPLLLIRDDLWVIGFE